MLQAFDDFLNPILVQHLLEMMNSPRLYFLKTVRAVDVTFELTMSDVLAANDAGLTGVILFLVRFRFLNLSKFCLHVLTQYLSCHA